MYYIVGGENSPRKPTDIDDLIYGDRETIPSER